MAELVQCSRKEDNFNWKKELLESLDISYTDNMQNNFENEFS